MLRFSKSWLLGVLLALLFFIPLIFNYWGFDIYEISKNIFFRLGLATMLVVWGTTMLRDKTNVYWGRGLTFFVCSLLAVLLLAQLTSIHPVLSFWGSYFRQAGVINFLLFILLFFLVVQTLKLAKGSLEKVLNVIIFTGLLVAVYAILQKFGWDIYAEFVSEKFAGRSFSSLGNPTSLGAYLIFPIGAIFAKLIKKRSIHDQIAKGVVGITILLVALVYSETRAAMIGLFVVVGIFVFYSLRNKKKLFITGLVSILVVGILIGGHFAKDLRSVNSRMSIWLSGLSIVKAQPILGSGAESFAQRFEQFVRPEFFTYEDYTDLVDRPHNEPLEWWIHFGIFGLVWYLLLLVILGREFFIAKQSQDKILILTVFAFLISNLFSFSWTTHYVMLVVFLAIIFLKYAKEHKINVFLLRRGVFAIALIVAVSLIIFAAKIFDGDNKLHQATVAILKGNTEVAVKMSKEAAAVLPIYPDVFVAAFNNFYAVGTTEVNANILKSAIDYNEKIKKLTGYNLRSFLNEVRIALFLEEFDLAEDIFLEIDASKAPNPVVYGLWADMYYQQKDFVKAAVVYDQFLQLLPPYWRAPILSGDNLSEKQRIFWKTHPDFIDTLKKIAESYVITGQDEKADLLLKELE